MTRRSTTAAAVLAVATLAAAVAGPQTAYAAEDTTKPVIRSARVVPGNVVLRDSGPTTITVEVDVTDDTDVEFVFGMLYRGTDLSDADDGVSLDHFARVKGTDTWRAHAYVDKAYQTGRYTLAVAAVDPSGNFRNTPSLVGTYLKRNTTMPEFNAGPEPARKGAPVTVSGRLERLTLADGYTGYAGKTVTVWFRPDGGAWTQQGTATTAADGGWSRTSAATVDGTWKATFAGTSNYHAETSHEDHVDVQ